MNETPSKLLKQSNNKYLLLICFCYVAVVSSGVFIHLLILQSFKNHQLHDVLQSPGTADITADVDFRGLARAAAEKREY